MSGARWLALVAVLEATLVAAAHGCAVVADRTRRRIRRRRSSMSAAWIDRRRVVEGRAGRLWESPRRPDLSTDVEAHVDN